MVVVVVLESFIFYFFVSGRFFLVCSMGEGQLVLSYSCCYCCFCCCGSIFNTEKL